MSLKAKIEAVIYASEEPVTLAQLVGLLGHEAQRELDRIAEQQQQLPLIGTEGIESVAASEATSEAAVVSPPPSAGGASEDQPTDQQATTVVATPDPSSEKRELRERERRLRDFLRDTVAQLIRDYAEGERGLEVREVAGGFRMATKPEYHDAVRGFVKSLKPPLTLSLQALETLAVVAYKQPVTAPEISEIRGVDSGGVLGSLMARKLIAPAGRKQVIGRPILYKTTKDFLLRFGLKDVNELPSIEEFEKMAGELAEQEEMDMPQPPHDVIEAPAKVNYGVEASGEKGDIPQADGDDRSLDAGESNGTDDEASVDGRMSGLPPSYAPEVGEDPSADEAAIQAGE